MPRSLLALALLCTACGVAPGTDPEVIAYTTLDQPIDHSLEADVGSPRLCVSGPNIYAVWHDDRRSGGRNQVFFNVGRGGGTHWGESDIQISGDPTGDSVAENPSIACAGDSVYVVWEDDRDSEFGHRSIYFRYSDDSGDTWQTDQLVTFDPDGDWDAQGPRIVVAYDPDVSPDRTLYIVWYDNRFGAYDVYFTRSTNGYNFLEQELRLDTDVAGAAYSAHPEIAVDDIGGVYVAWEDSRDGGNDVYVNRSFDRGDAWLAGDIRLDGGDDGGASDAFGVTIAVDREASQPAAYVAWHDDRSGGKDIYLNRSIDAGTTWQPEPTRIDNDVEGGSDSFYPSLYAYDDTVLVAWHDDRDLGFDVWLRGSDNSGETWGSEQRLDTDLVGSAHSLGPKLTGVGPNVSAVWSDYRRPSDVEVGHPDLYYRVSTDGGFVWNGEDARIDNDPQSTAISDDPQVVMSGPFVYVIWVDYRAGNADLWFRRMSTNTGG